MTTRQIRDLALRILGLYYMVKAIIYLPQILSILSMPAVEYMNRFIIFIAVTFPFVVYFLIAYVLFLKTEIVMAILWPKSDDETGNASIAIPIATWVSLIGLFYLIGTVPGITHELWTLIVENKYRYLDYSLNREIYNMLPDIITMILAMICIFKARKIAVFLKKKTE